MAGFAKKERQRIIDAYLNDTGRNQFIPSEFLAYLRERPDHEAYAIFFNVSDEQAAHQYRVQLVRSWVSGLRVNVSVSNTQHHVGRVQVGEYKMPGMISPMGNRKNGGGYVPVSDDPVVIAELRAQAAMALESWVERFGGVLEMSGGSVASVMEIVSVLADVADAA